MGPKPNWSCLWSSWRVRWSPGGAAVMVAMGLPALRVRGLTLAVTTMGFAVISADWLFRQGWAGSSKPFLDITPPHLGLGLGTPRSMLSVYYLALTVLALGLAA